MVVDVGQYDAELAADLGLARREARPCRNRGPCSPDQLLPLELEDGRGQSVGVGDAGRRGRQQDILGRRQVADGRQADRRVVDVVHGRRGCGQHLFQHAIFVFVDSPHPQQQADLILASA